MSQQRLRAFNLCLKGFVVALICAKLIDVPRAGTPPTLLDDNRGDLALEHPEIPDLDDD